MNKESNQGVIIGIHSADINLFVSNPLLIKIIEQIPKNFPFTYISLEALTNLSNKLDQLFWLIDKNGIIMLVNNFFAEMLGQEKNNIEGKNYIDFISSSQVKLFMMIDNYVKDVRDCISIVGAKFKVFHLPAEKQYIEYPILDNTNNLVAIAGISISKS
jgi:PAS domain-containing protein